MLRPVERVARSLGGSGREISFFEAMGHLKHDGKDDTFDEAGEDVEGQNQIPRVKVQRKKKGKERKDKLSSEQMKEIPSFRSWDGVAADLPLGEVVIIIEEMPLDHEQTVEKPEIEVLVAVESVVSLVRGESPERADFEIGIVVVDVGIGVVEVVVFPIPKIAVATEKIHGVKRPTVDPSVL